MPRNIPMDGSPGCTTRRGTPSSYGSRKRRRNSMELTGGCLEQRAVRLQHGGDVFEIVGNGELESIVWDLLASVDEEFNHCSVLPMRVTEVRRTVAGCDSRCAAVL